MSDHETRAREREAAGGDPGAEERAALARCRAGEHDWSAWGVIARWVNVPAAMQLGPQQAVDLGYTEKIVEQRTCYWCMRDERRRRPADLESDLSIERDVSGMVYPRQALQHAVDRAQGSAAMHGPLEFNLAGAAFTMDMLSSAHQWLWTEGRSATVARLPRGMIEQLRRYMPLPDTGRFNAEVATGVGTLLIRQTECVPRLEDSSGRPVLVFVNPREVR